MSLHATKPRVARIHSLPLVDVSEEGSAYYGAEIARRLHALAVDVEVWTKLVPAPIVGQPFKTLRCWQPGLFAWVGLLRTMVRRRPALVHIDHSMFMFGAGASSELSTLVVLAAATLLRIPLVVTLHDVPRLTQITPAYIELHKYRFPASIVRLGLRIVLGAIGLAAKRVVVHHGSLAPTLERDYGVPARKIACVALSSLPFTVPVREEARRRLSFSDNERVVLYFGFATGYKGIEPLLTAMETWRSAIAPTLVLGAGYHPKKTNNEDYETYYRELRIRASRSPNVRFVGFIADDELDDYVAACDVAIFPYVESQAMSGPLLQCVARGKPALVSIPIARRLHISIDDAFDVTSEGIARSIDRFFTDAAFHDRIVADLAHLSEQMIVENSSAEILAVYRQAGAAL